MSRKTIEVEHIKEYVNDLLESDLPEMKDARFTMIIFIEHILMLTGNYHGFQYLDKRDNSDPNFDYTRRVYY